MSHIRAQYQDNTLILFPVGKINERQILKIQRFVSHISLAQINLLIIDGVQIRYDNPFSLAYLFQYIEDIHTKYPQTNIVLKKMPPDFLAALKLSGRNGEWTIEGAFWE